MTFRMIALAAALGLATIVYAAPPAMAPAAKTMNYDCTKAGNKNKAACKTVVVAPKPMAAAPAMAPKAAVAPAMAAKPAAKPMNYDCTKAGNKNKAACKNVVVAPAVAMAPAKPAAPMSMAPAKPAAPMAMAKPRAVAGPKALGPNEVAATLKNGKVVHYDCGKTGNKSKKACAGK